MRDPDAPHADLTEKIIGCGIRIHRRLGPGLLEKTYEHCLAYELRKSGLHVDQQVLLPLVYDDVHLVEAYRVDLIVDNAVLVELKTVEKVTAVHEAQVLTYVKLSGLEVGLLLNFQTEFLRDGIKRFAVTKRESSAPSCPLEIISGAVTTGA
jgi:GxxExxY protein